jgi:hypothetical protein
MKFQLIFCVLVSLLLVGWLEVALAAHQRCKACRNKHAPPRGNNCPYILDTEEPEEPPAEQLPSCRTCHRRHPSPRGRLCDLLHFDDELHDPLADHPAERHDLDFPPSPEASQQVLLHRLSAQLTEMNAHILSINQRVNSLETAAQSRPVAAPRREAPGPDGGMRARMQALDINMDADHSDGDDWEVAGAGAAPQGKPLKSGACGGLVGRPPLPLI